MKTKLKLVLCLILIAIPLIVLAQSKEPEYKKWDSHDVKSVYVEVEEEEDADVEFDERFFEKKKLSSGVYEIEVIEKVDSKFWKIRGSNLFLYFRYNPYLYKYDEGILEWSGSDGIFYQKP